MPQKKVKTDQRRRSMLVLECDTKKLASQNLSVGDFAYQIANSTFEENPIELIKIDKEANLLEAFKKSFEMKKKYKNIFIIGHSNKDGIKIASDRFVNWVGLAQWLAPFQPKQITFLACQAANIKSCGTLFEEIQSLGEIFGSPINVNTKQSIIMLFNTLESLKNGKMDSSTLKIAQFTNFFLTKGLITHYTRKVYESYDETEKAVWSIIEDGLPNLFR